MDPITSPITPQTPTAPQVPQNAANPQASAGQAEAVLSSDFETFLKMLTTQAKYQDPLEPVDSSEYAAQLAQFSMVEQQVLSNDLLAALTSQLGAGNMGQMAGWIGMEARTTSPAPFDGTPIDVGIKPTAGADEAALIVRDVNGKEVGRQSVPLNQDSIQWTGRVEGGGRLPDGTYSFTLESKAKGEVLATDPAETYTRITEARIERGETVLVLQGGTSIASNQVTGLREPEAAAATNPTT